MTLRVNTREHEHLDLYNFGFWIVLQEYLPN